MHRSARLVGAAASVVLAASGLALATTPAAHAATTSGPTAVAVGPDGTSYAATATSTGETLVRIDATGAVETPSALAGQPVDGLAVDPAGHVWVDYGYEAVELSATDGSTLDTITYGTATSCPVSSGDPGTYGGIAVDAGYLYVAQRCGTGVTVYDIAGDHQVNAILNTAGGRPGRVALGVFGGVSTALYVSIPGAAQVDVYLLGQGAGAPPLAGTIPVTVQGGNGTPATPTPTGLAVDDQGQLFVVDSANNVVYVYDKKDASYTYQYDRYIGSPYTPQSYVGGLSHPTAIAQYARTGSSSELQGNLFVADAGNNRVERFNTYGYTFWAAPTDGSASTPGQAPINTTLPSVTGSPNVGQALTCDKGQWAGDPTTYTYGWNLDNNYISGATGSTYQVPTGTAGHQISCFVQAANAAGTSGYATSANVRISSGAPQNAAPVNTIRPTVDGTPQPGAVLTCENGTWTGTPVPTYTQQWRSGGNPIAGATSSTYTVQDADLGQQLSCAVTASNGVGSPVTASSVGVTVTSSTPPSTCGTYAGVSIDSAATYTRSASVSLRITPPAGATQVLISNDGGFDSATVSALSSSCTYPWTLASSGAARDTKVVYVRFAGGGHDPNDPGYSDEIVLDATAPTASAAKAVEVRTSKTYTVALSASDAVSGVAKVQYAAVKGGKGTTVTYRHSFKTQRPGQFAWSRVYDKAGNVSAWRHTTRVNHHKKKPAKHHEKHHQKRAKHHRRG